MGKTALEFLPILEERSKEALTNSLCKFLDALPGGQQRAFLDILAQEPATLEEIRRKKDVIEEEPEESPVLPEQKRPQQKYIADYVMREALKVKKESFMVNWTHPKWRNVRDKKRMSLHMFSDYVLLKIFSFLDLPVGVLKVDTVCKRFSMVSRHPMLWQSLNLKAFHAVFTDAAAKTVARNSVLVNTIDVSSCQHLTEIGVKWLAKWGRRVETIILRNCRNVGDRAMYKIGKYSFNLKKLDLAGCMSLSDWGMHLLSEGNCRKLEHLDISNNQRISFEGVLKVLHAYGSMRFETLIMNNCRLEDVWLAKMAGAKILGRLKTLGLSQCSHLTDVALFELVKSAKNLVNLDLSGCFQITDEGIRALSKDCPKLVKVNLSDCDAITDQSLRVLADGCVGLSDLNVARCHEISDWGLTMLSDRCKNLTILDITYCSRISANGLRLLQNKVTIIGASKLMTEDAANVYSKTDVIRAFGKQVHISDVTLDPLYNSDKMVVYNTKS